MLQNQIGLEAEYLLRNKEGEVVEPSEHHFDTDDFPLLGEIRGEPGETRAETVANFLKEWYTLIYQVEKQALSIDLMGYAIITPEKYAELLRKVGTKEIAQCRNIYDTDLLTLSNQITKRGVVSSVVVSTGLHVHFSSGSVVESPRLNLKPYEFSLKVMKGVTKPFTLYEKVGESVSKHHLSRITMPVIHQFVTKFDEEVLPKYTIKAPKTIREALKYRYPGFYETKPYGFEYRSLPFTEQVLADLHQIVGFAYDLLEAL